MESRHEFSQVAEDMESRHEFRRKKILRFMAKAMMRAKGMKNGDSVKGVYFARKRKLKAGETSASKSSLEEGEKQEREIIIKQIERAPQKGKAAAVDLGESSRSASEVELMKEEERAMERSNRKDDWVCEGIVVRVMSENGYYKQKGVVRKVMDGYVGEIEMLESKHVVTVDQKELKTVLPKIGGLVKIVNGAYRGCNARFLGINTCKFCPKVKIENGVYDGRVIQAIDYEDICEVL